MHIHARVFSARARGGRRGRLNAVRLVSRLVSLGMCNGRRGSSVAARNLVHRSYLLLETRRLFHKRNKTVPAASRNFSPSPANRTISTLLDTRTQTHYVTLSLSLVCRKVETVMNAGQIALVCVLAWRKSLEECLRRWPISPLVASRTFKSSSSFLLTLCTRSTPHRHANNMLSWRSNCCSLQLSFSCMWFHVSLISVFSHWWTDKIKKNVHYGEEAIARFFEKTANFKDPEFPRFWDWIVSSFSQFRDSRIEILECDWKFWNSGISKKMERDSSGWNFDLSVLRESSRF